MFYSVDRIIGDIAVCVDDNGEIFNISTDLIEGDFKEGSILKESDEIYFADTEEENSRREANFDLAESLFEN